MTDSNSGEAEEKPSLIQQFSPKLAKELGLPANRIQGTLDLLLSDNTIPFIARYRKEKKPPAAWMRFKLVRFKIGINT